MQILKTVVIAMGVLILAGFALLIYGFATQLDKVSDAETAALVRLEDPEGSKFGQKSAGLEAGEIVLQVMTEAGRLLLHTRNRDGQEQIRFYAIETGMPVGTLRLTADQP